MKKIIKQKKYFEKICSPDNLHLNFSESHKKYLGKDVHITDVEHWYILQIRK